VVGCGDCEDGDVCLGWGSLSVFGSLCRRLDWASGLAACAGRRGFGFVGGLDVALRVMSLDDCCKAEDVSVLGLGSLEGKDVGYCATARRKAT